MSQNFIGALDATLKADGEVTETGEGTFQSVEANIYDVLVTVSAQSGDPITVTITTDTGATAATFSIEDTTDLSSKVYTGSIPGGRKLKAAWTVPMSASATFEILACETAFG